MEDKVLIESLRKFKQDNNYTLHDLSIKLDIQVATLERWLRTKRINRIYAMYIQEKLKNENFLN